FGNGLLVAGTTSGGSSDNCLPTDHSYDANVYNYRSWIQMQAGPDLDNTSCGSLPAVGSSGVAVDSFSGALTTGGSALYSVNVGPGTSLLRVALNAVDDVDFFVKAGSAASATNYDCKQDGSSPFGACQFVNPSPGTWYVFVYRFAGSGLYQLTASRFGSDCENPDSDGLACDDGNSCTVNDSCRGGACVGAPEADGAACDDANPCTNPDICRSAVCVGGQSPSLSCKSSFNAMAGSVRLTEPAIRAPQLVWRWLRGSATDRSEFGDPVNVTPYSFCVYDQVGGDDALVFEKHVGASGICAGRPCWHKTMRGYRYSSKKALPTGISSVDLRSGIDGKAQITVRGHGNLLSLPPLPLHQQSTVTVQLSNGQSCWQGTYDTNLKNSSVEFRATAAQQ
ncbi:MAG TPA: PPC domain-containing protein, partial [Candidatus Acidoferrales bacterium]|nr:PPC domain-containing protein [Candidatus Acidoferrales bacterium]